MTSSRNIAPSSKENQAMTTMNRPAYRKFHEVWTVVFEIGRPKRANRQTYRHADTDGNTSHPHWVRTN